jgi:SpoVK/Ycf46/Vps4 family AAA+-type ATPase
VEVAGVAARLAAEAAAAEGEGLESHVRALRRAFEQNPFGDPAKIVESSEALVDWCRATERRLVEMRLDRREANRAIQLFAETAANAPHEYDTARQLVAAIAVINDELESTGVEMDRFADAVDQLRSRNYYLTEPPESRTQKVLVEALIPKQIANRAAYDPGEFAAQMNELNGLRSRD